ncbi:MAG: hypothetical protein IKT40_06040 [Bacilli bacterium]|nr:hypothetical protein [Bacilli bacterium]
MKIKRIDQMSETNDIKSMYGICSDANGKTEKFALKNIINSVYRVKDNKLQQSEDGGVTWNDATGYLSSDFRWSEENTIQISQDGGNTWSNLSEPFVTENIIIKGYVDSVDQLPSDESLGAAYMVGTSVPFHVYVKTSNNWVDNGEITNVTAGVVQTTGNSTTDVMSQKAVSKELNIMPITSNYFMGLSVSIDKTITENGVWTNVGNGSSVLIPIIEGDEIIITPKNNSSIQYAFISEVNGIDLSDEVIFVEGTNRTSSMFEVKLISPKNSKFLYLLTSYNGIKREFSNFTVNGTELLYQKPRILFIGSAQSLEEALKKVDLSKRIGQCIIYYRVGNSSTYKFYYFVSSYIENWETLSLWRPIYTGEDVDNIINDNIQGITHIIQNISHSVGIGFSSYNSGDEISYTRLNEYPLSQVGDYIEVKFKTNGGSTYEDWLNLVEGTDAQSRFGLYSNTQFWVRQKSTYIKWIGLPNMVSTWRTIKFVVVEEGVELFVDNISYGVKEYTETFIVCGLASHVLSLNALKKQRYDIDYFSLKSGNTIIQPTLPSFVNGSVNVILKSYEYVNVSELKELYVKKENNCIYMYKKLNGDKYVCYPLKYRYKAYSVGQYPSYFDNWGLQSPILCKFDGHSMIETANLFSSAEAELALSVPSNTDGTFTYVGGAMHGFENIIAENDIRSFRILIDSQNVDELSIIELKQVSKIEVIQQTELVQSYSESTPFAKATKIWKFNNDGLSINTSVEFLRDIEIYRAMLGMFGVYRHWLGDVNNNYLTNRVVKNNKPFITYNVEDDWDNLNASSPLRATDKNCTKITAYGDMGLGFEIEITDTNTKNYGGMLLSTNGGAPYNKIYYDATGEYSANIGEVISATQKWYIYGDNLS